MRLIVDVCLSADWVPFLRGHGTEAVHWSELGAQNADDTVIFGHAARHGFIIFTHDLDSGALLALAGANGPSVIQARVQDTSVETLGHRMVEALRCCQTQLEQGAIATLLADRTKVRILPI